MKKIIKSAAFTCLVISGFIVPAPFAHGEDLPPPPSSGGWNDSSGGKVPARQAAPATRTPAKPLVVDVVKDKVREYETSLLGKSKESKQLHMLRKTATVVYLKIKTNLDTKDVAGWMPGQGAKAAFTEGVRGMDSILDSYFYDAPDPALPVIKAELQKTYDKAMKPGTSAKDAAKVLKNAVAKIMYKDSSGDEFNCAEAENSRMGFTGKDLLLRWAADAAEYEAAVNSSKEEADVAANWDRRPDAPASPPPAIKVPNNDLFVQTLVRFPLGYARPVSYAQYHSKTGASNNTNDSQLAKETGERLRNQADLHTRQTSDQNDRFESEKQYARTHGATGSQMASLGAAQVKERAEYEGYRNQADRTVQGLEAMRQAGHAAADREVFEKKTDEARDNLWAVNLRFFEGKLKESGDGTLRGPVVVDILTEIQSFVNEGVLEYYRLDNRDNLKALNKLGAAGSARLAQLKEAGEWLPSPLSYGWAIKYEKYLLPRGKRNRQRYAKIVGAAVSYDPRTEDAVAKARKVMPAANLEKVEYKGDNPLYFSGLTKNAEIRVYDSSGGLLRTLKPQTPANTGVSGLASWDLKDENGNPVAAGNYYFIFSDPAGGNKWSQNTYISGP